MTSSADPQSIWQIEMLSATTYMCLSTTGGVSSGSEAYFGMTVGGTSSNW